MVPLLEFLLTMGWTALIWILIALILFLLKRINGFELPQVIKAFLFIPFTVITALMCTKYVIICL